MELNPNTNVNIASFIDDGKVRVSISVQVDAEMLLEELKKTGQTCVQAEWVVDALNGELETKLYNPLWQQLNELLK